jgi:hypothetical protein
VEGREEEGTSRLKSVNDVENDSWDLEVRDTSKRQITEKN